MSSQAWVNEPENGSMCQDDGCIDDSVDSLPASDGAPAVDDPPPAPEPTAAPHRGFQTITLGETTTPDGAPVARPAAASNAPTIVINNTAPGWMPTYGYGYGHGYGGGWGGGAAHGASTLQPGQSWPTVPSYGPSFPYPMGPASPWEHRR
jgi:hypothetical protein